MEIKKIIESRIARSVFVGSLSALALTACAEDGINHEEQATVVKHEYKKAYDSFMMAGKVPMVIHHDARYDLEVRQCGHEGQEGADSEGCITAPEMVSKQVYDRYSDGETIILADAETN